MSELCWQAPIKGKGAGYGVTTYNLFHPQINKKLKDVIGSTLRVELIIELIYSKIAGSNMTRCKQ